MSWLEKILPSIGKNAKKNIPEGLWSKCPECNRVLYQEELERLYYVCPKCDHHLRISARKRLESFLDVEHQFEIAINCLLYTSPSPRDGLLSRMPSSA